MTDQTELLEALPFAVYTTDVDGRITFYNEAAAAFWGHRPDLGSSRWCGSWRLFWPDGRPMRHDESPMAVSLREGRPVRGAKAIVERPDGTRVPFIPYPTPLKNAEGRVIGGINLLIDATDDDKSEVDFARLAAIVDGSDDAIVSKNLDGRVTSWNASATRIFGYEPEEMIGQSILRIIPAELRQEEAEILARLKRGERIEHFDTVRVAKDGRRVDVSLTVSPLRDKAGNIVGASKIGRDVSERKRAKELQDLLFDELNHRVKNTLATIQAIARQSLLRAASADEFVSSFNGRVQALGRAHDLLVQSKMKGAPVRDIVREQVLLGSGADARISLDGPFVALDARAAVHLALVLHELATNARKYGALSVPEGRLAIAWSMQAQGKRELLIDWTESGVRSVSAPTSRGFGMTLIERTLESNGGEASIRYDVGGIRCQIRLPLPEDLRRAFDDDYAPEPRASSAHQPKPGSILRGKRILVIEDEPLVAMDIESELIAAGCEVVGPAGSIKGAQRLIEAGPVDAALVDANLAGHPVDELAAALTQRAVPFAFATGYGREALPQAFRQAAVLSKPFTSEQLLAVVNGLLNRPAEPSDVVVRLKHAGVRRDSEQ